MDDSPVPIGPILSQLAQVIPSIHPVAFAVLGIAVVLRLFIFFREPLRGSRGFNSRRKPDYTRGNYREFTNGYSNVGFSVETLGNGSFVVTPFVKPGRLPKSSTKPRRSKSVPSVDSFKPSVFEALEERRNQSKIDSHDKELISFSSVESDRVYVLGETSLLGGNKPRVVADTRQYSPSDLARINLLRSESINYSIPAIQRKNPELAASLRK